MSKFEWRILWKVYRVTVKHEVSIARTLVVMATFYGYDHELVAQLAKVVLVNDDSLAQK